MKKLIFLFFCSSIIAQTFTPMGNISTKEIKSSGKIVIDKNNSEGFVHKATGFFGGVQTWFSSIDNETWLQVTSLDNPLVKTLYTPISTVVYNGSLTPFTINLPTENGTYATREWVNSQSVIASNAGIGGVGVFDEKIGNNLKFKNINSVSNNLTVFDDTLNNEIDLTINENNLISVVHKAGVEFISGVKQFENGFTIGLDNQNNVKLNYDNKGAFNIQEAGVDQFIVGGGFTVLGDYGGNKALRFEYPSLTALRTINWRDLGGTVALTSDLITKQNTPIAVGNQASLPVPSTVEIGAIYLTANDGKMFINNGSTWLGI